MTKEAAEAIVNEAKQDKRLEVAIDTKRTSPHHNGGYKVHVRLRKKDCNLIIKRPDDWPVVRDMWQGL